MTSVVSSLRARRDLLDESVPMSVADARDGSIFLLTYRWRRPVR